MSEVKELLTEYFDEEQASAVATILELGASYGEGDAFAGMKLSSISGDEWDRLSELFEEAGFDYELSNRMSVVGFTNDPETDDEELNEAIRNL